MQPNQSTGAFNSHLSRFKSVAFIALSFTMIDCSLLSTGARADATTKGANTTLAMAQPGVVKPQSKPLLQSETPQVDTTVVPEGSGANSAQQNGLEDTKALLDLDPEMARKAAAGTTKISNEPLQGNATYIEVAAKYGDTVHRLTKNALERNPKYMEAAEAVDHYRTGFQKALRNTKDALNYMYPYRGFSMSMEGSRVILDKEQKITNLSIAELAKQRYWDEMHPKVTAQIMQLTMGLGMQNPDQASAAIQKGLTGLTNLVGKEAAESTLADLAAWKQSLSIPQTAYEQETWDVESTERIRNTTLKTAADGDALIKYVYDSVKKYDHSKAANFAAGMIEANLAAATVLSGNPVMSLGAEAASTAFVMSTGGPEENKILKELYFGRRLELRRKRINDEAELALTNYQKAILTKNPTQLAMSEIVLSEIVGPDRVAAVIEHDPINDFSVAAPVELATTDTKPAHASMFHGHGGGKGIVLKPIQANKKGAPAQKE